jgi:magnesium chelatase family protein
MNTSVWTAVISEMKALPVEVQVRLSFRGLPRWKFTGRVSPELREGKERILSALKASGYQLPRSGVHVALFPSSIMKHGTGCDLAVALSVLQAHSFLPQVSCAAVAELDLEGRLLPVEQEYALVDAILAQGRQVIVPAPSRVIWKDHPLRHQVYCCENLREATDFLRKGESVTQFPRKGDRTEPNLEAPQQSISQSLLRVLCLCLAGGHHTVLLGSPGVGKSATKVFLEYLLPTETAQEERERRVKESLSCQPHRRIASVGSHISRAELFGNPFKRGRIHSGADLFFLDELLEFRKECREGLRQYLEIESQTDESESFRGTLVATSNPCPCGFSGTPHCTCRPDQKKQYLQRLSGSLLDRISIVWRVGEQDQRQLSLKEWQEVRKSIQRVRRLQQSRRALGFPEYARNYSLLQLRTLQPSFHLPQTFQSFRRELIPWQVAQTITDWNAQTEITKEALFEAQMLTQATYSLADMD